MIKVISLAKTYGKRQNEFKALDNVSFDIPNGKIVAIIGKSGSGKSTLMHLLGGLDHPSSGEIWINDIELSKLRKKSMDKFRARYLGFVFQSFFIEGNLSCYQNVLLPLEINEVKRSKRKGLVEKALAAVELSDKAKLKAKNLSGGQKQRLAIARAIVHRPRLILADEPTGNLDSQTGENIIRLLFSLHYKYGSDLVIVTHDPELAARCDVQISLLDGKIINNSDSNLKMRYAKPLVNA